MQHPAALSINEKAALAHINKLLSQTPYLFRMCDIIQSGPACLSDTPFR